MNKEIMMVFCSKKPFYDFLYGLEEYCRMDLFLQSIDDTFIRLPISERAAQRTFL